MEIDSVLIELESDEEFLPEEWAIFAVLLRPKAEVLLIANNKSDLEMIESCLNDFSKDRNLDYTREETHLNDTKFKYTNGATIRIMNLGENPWAKVHGLRFDIIIMLKNQYHKLSSNDCPAELIRNQLIRPMLRAPIEITDSELFRLMTWRFV